MIPGRFVPSVEAAREESGARLVDPLLDQARPVQHRVLEPEKLVVAGEEPLVPGILGELERSSPGDELALNIESAVEYIPLCEGRRGWRAELSPRAREFVERFCASGREPPDPSSFLALSEKEKLAYERAQVEKSAACIAFLVRHSSRIERERKT